MQELNQDRHLRWTDIHIRDSLSKQLSATVYVNKTRAWKGHDQAVSLTNGNMPLNR